MPYPSLTSASTTPESATTSDPSLRQPGRRRPQLLGPGTGRRGVDTRRERHPRRGQLHLAECRVGHARQRDRRRADDRTLRLRSDARLSGHGDYGRASGNGTIVYTDGTTQPFILSFATGGRTNRRRAATSSRPCPTSTPQPADAIRAASVYYASVPLQPGKTVQYVTLPTSASKRRKNNVAMHIFAIAIG